MIPHMYRSIGNPDDKEEQDQEFFDFYEDVCEELVKFGRVQEFVVLDNLGEHMFGNIYVRYESEDDAEKAMRALSGRYYLGQMLQPEYSSVTDFGEARCRQYEERGCGRGGYCNFMHVHPAPGWLRRTLKKMNMKVWGDKGRSGSRSPRARRSRSPRRYGRRYRSRSRSASPARNGRSESEERRARIAEWNKGKEVAP